MLSSFGLWFFPTPPKTQALKTRRAEEPPDRAGTCRGCTRGEVPAPRGQSPAARRGRPAGSGGGMRLPELCLALLYAAGTGSEPPRAARERPLAPAAAAGRGLDPRQAWMLLAGSPGRASGDRGRGRTGAHTAPAGSGSPGKASSAAPASPTMPEELLRELQLLLRGVAKMCRTAGEGCKEEKSSKGNLVAVAQHRVEAAFHCQTCEDIAVKQMWQELGPFYIPEREGMFHRGPGLNLTSGQYTAPIAGYYTFSSTLHIARREPRRKGQGWRQSRLRVLICVQSRCQHNRYGRAGILGGGKESSSPGKGGACSPCHHPLSSAAIWRLYLGWRAAVTSSPSLSQAPCTCRLGSMPLFSWTTQQALPSQSEVAQISVLFSWECEEVP